MAAPRLFAGRDSGKSSLISSRCASAAGGIKTACYARYESDAEVPPVIGLDITGRVNAL
jgi:hypothetical protein